MLTLALQSYGEVVGFEYNPKFGPFKNATFSNDEEAYDWLRAEHGGREIGSELFTVCDCGTCDHCAGNPMTGRAA